MSIALTKFEARLVRVLRAVFDRFPPEQAIRDLAESLRPPRCLSRAAVRLIEQTLSRGVVDRFARAGFSSDRFLRTDRTGDPMIAEGPIWRRTPPAELGLTFSPNSLHLLIWLISADLSVGKSTPRFDAETVTVGDRVLITRLSEFLRETSFHERVSALPGFQREGLLDLLCPGDRSTAVGGPLPGPERFTVWAEGIGATVIECEQDRLQRVWADAIHDHRRFRDADDIRGRGEYLTATLDAFATACERAGRRDLCRFLIPVLAETVRDWRPGDRWFSRADFTGLRMADRAELYRAATPVLHHGPRLEAWDRWARGTGFYDEDYQAGQLFKETWEQHRVGEAVTVAGRILQSFEAIVL